MKVWLWRLIPTVVATVALVGIYLTFDPAGNEPPRTAGLGGLEAFVMHAEPKALPELSFTDGVGKPVRLADFRGRTLLLNIWATWCAPCRKEMPDLARLQEELGGAGFMVVAVSIDRQGASVAADFLRETKAESLTLYLDPSARILTALQSVGLPTTLLIDAQGRELGRLMGPADWASPEAMELVRGAMAP